MARHPSQRPSAEIHSTRATGDLVTEVRFEHVITHLYVLPVGSAANFLAELEDDAEEPTPALRALLRGATR